MGVTLPGAAGEVKENYEISNSLRFNDDDSPDLDITSADGNEDIWTWSAWIKRSTLKSSGEQFLFCGSSNGSTNTEIKLQNDQFTYINFNGSSNNSYIRTNAKLRDTSAWYHLVCSIDMSQSTDTNRIKLYINGVHQTSLDQTTYASQNTDTYMNVNSGTHRIGADARTASNYFDGYMTEVHFIDGTAKAQTDFGEFDDNGVWIPKRYTGSHGTNGFFMQFKQTGTSANSSGIGADTSGNDKHYTPANLAAQDITEDTCTNNFATLNPLAFGDNVGTLSEGNLKHTHNGGDSDVVSTIGISNGKFYAEFKVESDVSGRPAIAVYNDYDNGATNYGSVNGSVLFLQDGRILVDNSSIGDFGSISQNDIIQVAVDNDNGAIYIGQNGSYLNSGDPTSGSSRTGSVSNFTAGSVTCFIGTRANSNSFASANFGNPAFSISSRNNDGKYGNFEYAPPSGYYALCTKRLAEFG